MTQNSLLKSNWVSPIIIGASLLIAVMYGQPTGAIDRIPDPDPRPGSYGLEATKPQAPPQNPASISTPGNGASFSTSPITVTGICQTGLLVQVHNNGVMVGSVMCEDGTFSVQVSLFTGQNELSAMVYDDLEQQGPASNVVTVNYNDSRLSAFGQLITLTSSYGRISAPMGSELSWPLQLTGGTGPYALSINWGDGTDDQLVSQAMAGLLNVSHVYQKAGIYTVNVRVTDANGVSAFLQLVAVSSGKVEAGTTESPSDGTIVRVLWIPAVVSLVLLLPAYWLGRRSQLVSLRQKMLKERDSYQSE